MRFSNFGDVQNYLNSLVNYEHEFPLGGKRDRPKLDATYAAADRLALSLAPQNCVHIAGTKGKGSTVAMLEALLSPDFKTLSFTSPHLVSVKERVRLNGGLLSDDIWQCGFEAIVGAIEQTPAIGLTYFEIGFIFFLWAARELKTEVHLVEAGLGGRWDATNVLQNTIAVLTPVDYDHTQILGNTLTEIATDKGGIIKPNAQVVVGKQHDEVSVIYDRIISEQHATLFRYVEHSSFIVHRSSFPDAHSSFILHPSSLLEVFSYQDDSSNIHNLHLPLTGTHQQQNAAVAIRVARLIKPDLAPDTIRNRLEACMIPGRQQFLSGKRDVLLDVAHNPASFAVLAETLRTHYANRRILAVVGMSKDKDARSSLAYLKDLVKDIAVIRLSNPRSYTEPELLAVVEELGFNSVCVQSREEAFMLMHTSSEHDLGLVVGSFYLAGDYLEWRESAGIA